MNRSGLPRLPYEAARRVVVAVVGATLMVAGLIMVFTPGPAIVVLTLALTVLAMEFAWAKRWLRRLERTAKETLDHFRSESATDASAQPALSHPETNTSSPSQSNREGRTTMSRRTEPTTNREPDHEVLPIFPRRWSPRAMSGAPLEEEEILRLFEAARWAPSTFNEQEWRFVYARRDGPHWDTFFGLLAEANQKWCHQAGLIGCVLSHQVFARNGKPNPVNVFDSGLAYMSLALQGSEMGLVVHGLLGFDAEKARQQLKVPDDYNVNAMFVVGHPGDPDDLPEAYRERETPSGRKPVEEIAREGPFEF